MTGVVSWRDEHGEEWVPSIVAAERLGVDPHDIRNWVARDRIRSERVAGRRWVNYQDCAVMERAGREYRARAVERRLGTTQIDDDQMGASAS